MSDYKHYGTFVEGDLSSVTKEIKGIGDSLADLARGMKRLGVDVYDRADRAEEAVEHENWLRDATAQLDAMNTPAAPPDGSPSGTPDC